MIEKIVPITAKNDRPIIVWRIWRPVSRSFSPWNRSISWRWRPNAFDSRMPDTESVSSVMDVRSASDCCVTVATFCLAFPTLYVSHMKNGTMKRDRTVSCHDRRSMAITVLVMTTTFDRMDEAVSVTTVCTPPTSFASRDWISPVRVAVKNRSGMNWRWRYSAFRKSCMTRSPTRLAR